MLTSSPTYCLKPGPSIQSKPNLTESVVANVPKEPATLEKESPYRLPDFALPISYEIRLAPDLTTFNYVGSEMIGVLTYAGQPITSS